MCVCVCVCACVRVYERDSERKRGCEHERERDVMFDALFLLTCVYDKIMTCRAKTLSPCLPEFKLS